MDNSVNFALNMGKAFGAFRPGKQDAIWIARFGREKASQLRHAHQLSRLGTVTPQGWKASLVKYSRNVKDPITPEEEEVIIEYYAQWPDCRVVGKKLSRGHCAVHAVLRKHGLI